MKKIIELFVFFSLVNFVNAQNINTIEKNLKDTFQKIEYWHSNIRNIEYSYDSLDIANKKFEKLLLKYTSSNSKTLKHNFKSLEEIGLIITTSEDGKFRIYSWDTWTGGTMHFFKNIYQYEANKKVYSKTINNSENEGDPGCFYFQVNDIITENTKFYITQSRAIFSTGLTYNNLKVFSISDSKLDDNAKLIKTNSGIKNQLGYEVDLTASSNRNNNIKNSDIKYDSKKKIISIPLIQEDGKITSKRIRYQFNGKYFEKK